MLASLVGLCLVEPSGCALNNFIDRDIDAKMQWTCKRVTKAKLHIVLYIAVFALVSALLPLAGYTGIAFMALDFQVVSQAPLLTLVK